MVFKPGSNIVKEVKETSPIASELSAGEMICTLTRPSVGKEVDCSQLNDVDMAEALTASADESGRFIMVSQPFFVSVGIEVPTTSPESECLSAKEAAGVPRADAQGDSQACIVQ